MKASDLLTIGDVARRTGLAVSAIRFYEEKGLIETIRTSGGQRRFLRSDLRRLSFIRITQGCGFSLPDIRDMLAGLPHGRTPNAADWSKLATAMRDEVERRIAMLRGLRDRLDGCIGCGCLSLSGCALANPADRQGQKGNGARLILHAADRKA